MSNSVFDAYSNYYNLLYKNINYFEEVHPMRHLSLCEIDLLVKKNGFKRVQTEEFLTRKPVSEDTWGASVTLKKI